MLEKSLNDKMLLTEEEKKELQAIIETSKVLEEMIYKFSNWIFKENNDYRRGNVSPARFYTWSGLY